jgi:hypothetical protein
MRGHIIPAGRPWRRACEYAICVMPIPFVISLKKNVDANFTFSSSLRNHYLLSKQNIADAIEEKTIENGSRCQFMRDPSFSSPSGKAASVAP